MSSLEGGGAAPARSAGAVPTRAAVALWVLAAAGQAWLVLHDVLGVGGPALDPLSTNLVQNNLFLVAAILCAVRAVRRRTDRAAWWVISFGAFLWFPAETLYHLVISKMDPVPFPSVTDAFWLASYPCFYVGLVLLARRRLRQAGSALWLDGVIGALATAAVGAAIVLPVVAPALGGPIAVVATNLAYPLTDLVLLGFVVAMTALWGWRPGRAWLTLGTGLLVLVVADSMYLLQIAKGSYAAGDPVDAVWTAALLTVALAAWQPSDVRSAVDLSGKAPLALPTAFVLVALAVLAYDHFFHVNLVAAALAVATLLAAAARTALAFRELRAFAETRRQATTDDLTGLSNRRAFVAGLADAVAAAQGTAKREPRTALVIIDLDRFKEINDTLGHAVGDELLCRMGERLAASLPDGALLARLGGDEFGILLPGVEDLAAAQSTAERLSATVREPFSVDGVRMQVGASMGIAASPDHGRDPVVLLRCADVAMYQAKESGAGIAVYAAEKDAHDRDRLLLAHELRTALEAGELCVFYQPKVGIGGGEIRGMEALVRWPHARLGIVAPDVFVPLAEQTGLMKLLTESVLEQAVAECAGWRRDGFDLTVAVNLSVTNLMDAELPASVSRTLAAHGLPPSAVTLEITEDQLMGDRVRAQDILHQLRDLGVRIAIDDFGTGYSSLSYLRTLPVDELKIDKSFVMQMAEQPDDAAVVRLTVDLAHSLRLAVVAEGVETAGGLDILRGYGAETAQGYLISRPLPAAEVGMWLRRHRGGWTPAALDRTPAGRPLAASPAD